MGPNQGEQAMAKKTSMRTVKTTAKKRTLNARGSKASEGAPFNDQDVKRRLGNFVTAGEHARQGGRGTGIVGQTKQRFRTDKRKK
jgi:hypothetical protein